MAGILNLTTHPATPSQVAAGVIEPSAEDKTLISNLSNFEGIPSKADIKTTADMLSDIAGRYDCDKVMITGAPYLMSALETALEAKGMEPVYSFSERVSVDRQNPDGTVTKQNVFEHRSFVEPAGIKIEDSAEKVNVTKEGILNLTQHKATDGQVAAGVREPSDKSAVQDALTFRGGATADDIKQKANALADIAKNEGYGKVMIGGAGYLMKPLETALSARGIEPVYAFSERNVKSEVDADGKMHNTVTFEHKGFVEVEPQPADAVDNGTDAKGKDSAASEMNDAATDDDIDPEDGTPIADDDFDPSDTVKGPDDTGKSDHDAADPGTDAPENSSNASNDVSKDDIPHVREFSKDEILPHTSDYIKGEGGFAAAVNVKGEMEASNRKEGILGFFEKLGNTFASAFKDLHVGGGKVEDGVKMRGANVLDIAGGVTGKTTSEVYGNVSKVDSVKRSCAVAFGVVGFAAGVAVSFVTNDFKASRMENAAKSQLAAEMKADARADAAFEKDSMNIDKIAAEKGADVSIGVIKGDDGKVYQVKMATLSNEQETGRGKVDGQFNSKAVGVFTDGEGKEGQFVVDAGGAFSKEESSKMEMEEKVKTRMDAYMNTSVSYEDKTESGSDNGGMEAGRKDSATSDKTDSVSNDGQDKSRDISKDGQDQEDDTSRRDWAD